MCVLDQTTLSLISAAGGLIAAAGGLFAAVAAFRSAGTAKEAAAHAKQIEHRAVVRDVLSVAQNIIAETMRVDDIGNKLKKGYSDLAMFSGQHGGSRKKVLTEEVEKKQKGIIPFQQEALKTIDEQEHLRALEESQLTNRLIKYEGQLIQVRRVKEKLNHELTSVDQQNNTYRENVIKGT